MHTGYVPNGSVRYPAFGAVAAKYAGPQEFDLPHFVTVGGRGGGNGSGPLGMAYTPFVVNDPNRMPNNVEMPGGVNSGRFERRLGLMRDLSEEYAESGGRNLVEAHGTVVNGAARMVRSPRLRAFDLSQERAADRDRYGRNAFGQGCLLARRLVEAGVTFVEVESNGWDTHQENFTATRRLAGTVDPGFGSLVTDLRERGLLERTLVIWMGEFGRTPRINGNNGRDHWPRSFTVALAGAGIRGGRTLGATSSSGTEVTQRPVGVADLFCTFCQALGINPRREYMTPLARPVPIVEGGRPVAELFS
jgi:hypothetical protein